MLLSEIVKGVLLEGKASSFLKFYNELGRGYDPDDAILFDCLMTLKEYYESYMQWYEDFPDHKKTDVEVIPHFQKRLNEILIALQSDNKKKKILAIDNGINQWHIDMPIIRHLQMGCEDGSDNIGPEEKGWMEVEDLLIKLGKIKPERQFKRIYREGHWPAGFVQEWFYWVSADGKHHKVNNHQSYADTVSKLEGDDSLNWMYARGWMRVTIAGHEIFINKSLDPATANDVHLTKGQREWVKIMMELYSGAHLRPVTLRRKSIEI